MDSNHYAFLACTVMPAVGLVLAVALLPSRRVAEAAEVVPELAAA